MVFGRNSLLLLLLLVLMASCSPSHDGSSGNSSNPGTVTLNPNPDPLLEAAAITVLNNSCVGCHNGSQSPDLRPSAINDLKGNTLYVSIGRGTSSSLYTRMVSAGASMPPAGNLAGPESDKIKDWIDDLGIITEGGDDSLTAATFTDIETNILVPKCYSCHNTTAPIFTDYASVLNLIVTPNNLDSVFYTSVTTGSSNSGLTMPRSQTALTDEETDAIASWIMNGAPND
jgi:mono/diheme cytochrome c family protein